MTPQAPEDIIAMFVSGLLKEKRFSVTANDDGNNYTISIETPSRNQGRVLGAQRAHLDDLITLGKRIDPNIKIVVLDPNEDIEMNEVKVTIPLIAVQAFLDMVGLNEEVSVIGHDGGKVSIIDHDGALKWDVRNALLRLAFDIGRTNRTNCEITWE